ncbi:MAG: shikimate dehydrogenase family protein [Niabella sp.]
MRLFGLIGFPLAQSFSKKYFAEKFLEEGIKGVAYELFELENINQFPGILKKHPNLVGINVTIPYKQEVLAYLQELDLEAKAIGAVNCIKITPQGLKGYNTDAAAFENSLKPLLRPHHKKALVLGTGGAAKAVAYVLQKLSIDFKYVSRSRKNNGFTYEELNEQVLNEFTLIVNCTPLGSYPKTGGVPAIPYEYISSRHYLYDLVYNPPLTLFLQNGQKKGAAIKNGYDMLVGQAELGWQIWNAE